jgi:hypothetical protein
MASSGILGAGANGKQDMFSRGSTNYGPSKAPNFKNGSGKKNAPKDQFRAAILRKMKKNNFKQ